MMRGMRWHAGRRGVGLVALLSCVAAVPSQAREACHVIGEAVRLHGHLATRTFAPDHESLVHGDAREAEPVLTLNDAMCVKGMEGPGDGRRHRIKLVQVLDAEDRLSGEGIPSCRTKAHCTLSGILARADEGRHHAPVMIELRDDDAVPRRSHRRR